jgi:hypothetical protein
MPALDRSRPARMALALLGLWAPASWACFWEWSGKQAG